MFDPVPEHLLAGSADQVLLFDLSASIEENDEVSAQHPDIVAQLGKKLDAYVAQAWTPEKGPYPALSPQCAKSAPKNQDGPGGEWALTPYCKL